MDLAGHPQHQAILRVKMRAQKLAMNVMDVPIICGLMTRAVGHRPVVLKLFLGRIQRNLIFVRKVIDIDIIERC